MSGMEVDVWLDFILSASVGFLSFLTYMFYVFWRRAERKLKLLTTPLAHTKLSALDPAALDAAAHEFAHAEVSLPDPIEEGLVISTAPGGSAIAEERPTTRLKTSGP